MFNFLKSYYYYSLSNSIENSIDKGNCFIYHMPKSDSKNINSISTGNSLFDKYINFFNTGYNNDTIVNALQHNSASYAQFNKPFNNQPSTYTKDLL